MKKKRLFWYFLVKVVHSKKKSNLPYMTFFFKKTLEVMLVM